LNVKANALFEVSWEICNKVGGIYTVIKSKAALMQKNYQNYYLIGPYFEEKAKFEFTEKTIPKEFRDIFKILEEQGIVCHYGTWNINSNPQVILIDFKGFVKNKDNLKKEYWEKFKIDSLSSNWDFEEPMIWATAAGKIIELFYEKNKSLVAHFHEWLAGFGLLNLKCPTVFTTHATILGRTLSSSDEELYDIIDKIDPVEKSKQYNITDKFSTEVASAKHCTILTTVSEITALEVEKFLKRKPDVLLLNGLDADKFPSFEELSIKHQENKRILKEFIAFYFFPYYYINLDETYIFFICGRYEFKNKGIDIFIKSLKQLNERLIKENSEKTFVVFFWIPTQIQSAKNSLAENKLNFHQIKHYLEKQSGKIVYRIINNTMQCSDMSCFTKDFEKTTILDKKMLQDIAKLRIHFQKQGKPPLVTHNISNENQDPIIQCLLENGLDNSQENKVKAIFYPVYLTGIDGLTDLPYYDSISGCHLGVFPSYYEPWGYTPLESAALGVPSLTTDLGGFGKFLISKKEGDKGIYVLKRFKKPEEDIITDFTKILYNYSKLNRQGRVQEKIKAKQLSKLADWNKFIDYYIQAQNLALEKNG